MATKSKNVVLIDDNAIFRMVFGAMLTHNENLDLTVCSYENALDALDGLKSDYDQQLELPDYLFVDINMPYMTGWELMEKIKEKEYAFLQNCKIFIISSSPLESDVQRIQQYPYINDYILKPVSKEKLLHLLTTF
ncbi:MAG: response regulator [Sphingobacterium composti]|uniref:response regulator n=1 Tax=Sphingobacterium composti TaxID=363260 RepID=UPI00135B0C34|nr:response regulator [Sphingobacterium composti Ten et al. 2007 non Yoo et al. 2007]